MSGRHTVLNTYYVRGREGGAIITLRTVQLVDMGSSAPATLEGVFLFCSISCELKFVHTL